MNYSRLTYSTSFDTGRQDLTISRIRIPLRSESNWPAGLDERNPRMMVDSAGKLVHAEEIPRNFHANLGCIFADDVFRTLLQGATRP